MTDAADFLGNVSLFSLLQACDLKRVAESTHRHVYHDGDMIIREGENDNRLFVIVSGEVEVVKDLGEKDERSVRILGPHSYFGEMALIDDLERSASVLARGETEVLSLTKAQLQQEIERYPTMAFELLQMLSRRMRAIEKTMIQTLGTLLPICANCKKIRTEDHLWIDIDEYIQDHSETEFTYSMCPACSQKLYPQFYK